MEQVNIVAQRIRETREKRQMSIPELAEALPGDPAANANLIQSLENGETVPSLTPLLQIARALGVRLGSFLDDQGQNQVVLTRAGQIQQVNRFVGSNLGKTGRAELAFHSLAANKQDRHLEPFIIDVKPHKDEPLLSSHEGEEFIYVLKGEIEISYGKDTHRLSAGDSIYYDSVVPHHLHAAGDSEATILAVVYAPL